MNNRLTMTADSGSTKTHWAVGSVVITTQGINPCHQTDDDILATLRNELLPAMEQHHLDAAHIVAIHFYGSGVRPEQQQRMEQLLHSLFASASTIEARSDMLGAARALCGNSPGMACILGTGANSCLYDGHDIVANTPAMGYILGDEGSGAVLGRNFLNALYRNRLFDGAQQAFERWAGMNMADVIERVYRQPMANRWLASLSLFIHQHIGQPTLQELVTDNFRQFIAHHIEPYHRRDLPLSAVGSIAWYYSDQLTLAVKQAGYTMGRIMRSPLDNEGLKNEKS